MAALRAAAPHFSRTSMAVLSRCCASALRATRAAGLVTDHSACRFMSAMITGDEHATGFSSHGEEPHSSTGVVSRSCTAAHRATRVAGVVGDYPAHRSMSTAILDDEQSTGFSSYGDEAHTFGSIFASLPGAGSGEKKEGTTGQNSGPSTSVNLQKVLDMVKDLDLNESERKIFLNAVDSKFSLYKRPAEVAQGIRKMELKTMAEMTWLLEALYVKCGPWIYVVDHQLKKRGIKEEPDFTMDEYDQSPSEIRTELKIDRVIEVQRITSEILVDLCKAMRAVRKPSVPMFSITIGGRTIDFSGLLWKLHQ